MSVIADALKKAQRERLRRSSATGPAASSPFIVQLRTTRGPVFSWPRALATGAGAALLIAAIALAVQIRGSADRPPLPAVPPPPVSERIVESPRIAVGRPSSIRSSSDASHMTPPAASALVGARGSDTTGAVAGARTATPQGETRENGPSTPTTRATERLRISVDQPRGGEYAQLFEQAVASQRSNDTATARALYERLLTLAPDDPDVLNNFGVLLSATRDHDRAAQLLQRAVSTAPANAAVWANLGFALREQGKTVESIAAFEHALALEPARVRVRVILAQQYLATGAYTEARNTVQRVLADDPSSAEAYYTRGQLFELQGDRASAVRDYTEFLRLSSPRLASYAQRVRDHLDSLTTTRP